MFGLCPSDLQNVRLHYVSTFYSPGHGWRYTLHSARVELQGDAPGYRYADAQPLHVAGTCETQSEAMAAGIRACREHGYKMALDWGFV